MSESAFGTWNDVPLFEFGSAMDPDPRLWADCVHVNAEGARVMADLFADAIAKDFLNGKK